MARLLDWSFNNRVEERENAVGARGLGPRYKCPREERALLREIEEQAERRKEKAAQTHSSRLEQFVLQIPAHRASQTLCVTSPIKGIDNCLSLTGMWRFASRDAAAHLF